MIVLLNKLQNLLDLTRKADFLAPLALRLYLFPVMWMAGMHKVEDFSNTVAWFGNSDWGLGMPFPTLMASLATGVEVIGAICLLLGFAVRWAAIPLFMTMMVAAWTVHWKNGWLAIAEGSGFFATERTIGAVERLDRAKEILREHGHYQWLSEHGNFVVLNNGVEFAMTYAVMLLALFFMAGGRFVSVDYWLARCFRQKGGLE